MVPSHPESLHFQRPRSGQEEDSYPTAARQETGEGSRGEKTAQKKSSGGKKPE